MGGAAAAPEGRAPARGWRQAMTYKKPKFKSFQRYATKVRSGFSAPFTLERAFLP